ncbi:fumarylacetoacetate hydrolase family protein [Piscinibacter sakaiensis]|uniref:fumarylacetoacetate hydrolase family protein n=1 Tax=Piscinibacter sakaiensis TaxID=1547922 RepID=UPI003AB0DFED
MRFVTFRGDDGAPVAGAIRGDQVIDLSHRSCTALLDGCAPSLLAMVERGLDGFVQRIRAAEIDAAALRPLAGLQLLAPLQPGKILGAAFNFTDALAERGMAHPAEPVTFFRSGKTVVGPGEPIRLPPDAGNVGYEGELAVVIGRRALRIEPGQVMGIIAGYTAHNDVSGSALIKADGGNFVRGKNLPASSPLGPWLVSADEIADPHRLGIRLDIDGRKLQDGSTATMLFRIPELISWLSYRYPLEPGDVIATGTPAGVAAMHEPPAWLRPGTTISVEVEGIGRLVNPIEAGVPFVE